jgi:type II secretory pathway predicted ATPase ExeA
MYYEYWGLKKPPFDNVPDPSMYVDCGTTMENAIAETLFAIEEGGECIAVIVGDVGLGKTLSLRIIIDSLDPEKYRMALITNPGISFVQLLREIIGQLTGEQCNAKRKGDLLALFNKILFQTIDEDKQVLIFIDEANAMTPANLESLRLLTNLQLNEMNMFTIVLAGQLELARRLEHPKRANLYQRIGTYGKIEKLGSVKKLKTYIDKRLELAGANKQIFTEDAYEFLWEHSDNGVPRLINKIAKLSLKAGETNQFDLITGEVVNQIGECFQKLTCPSAPKRRPRKKPERKVISEKKDFQRRVPVEMEDREEHSDDLSISPISPTTDTETVMPLRGASIQEEVSPKEHSQEKERSHAQVEQNLDTLPGEKEQTSENQDTKEDIVEILQIGNHSFEITIPYHIIEHGVAFSQEKRAKLAGAFAAYILRKNGEFLTNQANDPVHVWGKIKNVVLAKFN